MRMRKNCDKVVEYTANQAKCWFGSGSGNCMALKMIHDKKAHCQNCYHMVDKP